MSAWLLPSKTIASLAYRIFTTDSGAATAEYRKYNSWKELAEAMTLMNLTAVGQRYGAGYEREPISQVSTEAMPVSMSRMQFYKSLNCFIYQCTEGDVPDMPLYKSLSELADGMPEAYRDTEESAQAIWG